MKVSLIPILILICAFSACISGTNVNRQSKGRASKSRSKSTKLSAASRQRETSQPERSSGMSEIDFDSKRMQLEQDVKRRGLGFAAELKGALHMVYLKYLRIAADNNQSYDINSIIIKLSTLFAQSLIRSTALYEESARMFEASLSEISKTESPKQRYYKTKIVVYYIEQLVALKSWNDNEVTFREMAGIIKNIKDEDKSNPVKMLIETISINIVDTEFRMLETMNVFDIVCTESTPHISVEDEVDDMAFCTRFIDSLRDKISFEYEKRLLLLEKLADKIGFSSIIFAYLSQTYKLEASSVDDIEYISEFFYPVYENIGHAKKKTAFKLSLVSDNQFWSGLYRGSLKVNNQLDEEIGPDIDEQAFEMIMELINSHEQNLVDYHRSFIEKIYEFDLPQSSTLKAELFEQTLMLSTAHMAFFSTYERSIEVMKGLVKQLVDKVSKNSPVFESYDKKEELGFNLAYGNKALITAIILGMNHYSEYIGSILGQEWVDRKMALRFVKPLSKKFIPIEYHSTDTIFPKKDLSYLKFKSITMAFKKLPVEQQSFAVALDSSGAQNLIAYLAFTQLATRTMKFDIMSLEMNYLEQKASMNSESKDAVSLNLELWSLLYADSEFRKKRERDNAPTR